MICLHPDAVLRSFQAEVDSLTSQLTGQHSLQAESESLFAPSAILTKAYDELTHIFREAPQPAQPT